MKKTFVSLTGSPSLVRDSMQIPLYSYLQWINNHWKNF